MQEGDIAYLCEWTNPGDTTEIFYHVTHNTIDCGLQEKSAIRCNECLPCQIMLKYVLVTLLNKLVVVRLLIIRETRVNHEC